MKIALNQLAEKEKCSDSQIKMVAKGTVYSTITKITRYTVTVVTSTVLKNPYKNLIVQLIKIVFCYTKPQVFQIKFNLIII